MASERLRVACGGIWHESNTFAARRTVLDDFRAYQFAEGDELLQRYRGTNTELGGMIQAAEEAGILLVPALQAAAVPGGTIEAETFEWLLERLAGAIRQALPLDGVLLALHGAAVAEDAPHADTTIVERVREIVNPRTPLVATFDLHANIDDALVRLTDMLIGYDTFPHVDMLERGHEAVRMIERLCTSARPPAAVHCKLPLLTVPQVQSTNEEPLAGLYARLHALEDDGTITCGSIAMGFPYADVPALGASVITYADSPDAAHDAAVELSDALWRNREAFVPELHSVDEAVERAMSARQWPVVLVDPADNVGGGSPGDGTEVLEALLRHGARDAVIVLCDPEAAQTAAAAGEGGRFSGSVGGKSDDRHGSPVAVEGRVVRTGEFSYRHSGSYMRGITTHMGLTAVIECEGNRIVLTSLRTMPFDIEQLRCVGIEPSGQRIVVVKSALAWRAAYGPLARQIVYADTPGVCSSNLHRFTYTQVDRPLYPLQQSGQLRPECRTIRDHDPAGNS